jgi:transcriptional regulator with XRE-family HTH domain
MRRKRIHNYLRMCRKARGFTQKEVAWIMGFENSSMISRWEKGVTIPETLNAIKIAALYNTTVDSVYEDVRNAASDELDSRVEAILKTRARQYE